MLKDWPKVYRKIKRLRGLDEHEKILFARSLAATSDERWRMSEMYLRSLGLWGRSALKKFDSNMPLKLIRKSKTAITRTKDAAHIHYIDETLRMLRAKKKPA
jgi:hypothetical protein